MLNQPILWLKKGKENTKGKEHLMSNFQESIGKVIRSTLGPRDTDKIIIEDDEQKYQMMEIQLLDY